MLEESGFENALYVASEGGAADVKQLLGLFDTPAYLRRAQRVEEGTRRLFEQCARRRREWLENVARRMRQWNSVRLGLAPNALATECSQQIESLNAVLQTTGELAPEWAQLARPAAVWKELSRSVARFNSRWNRYVDELDLTGVNELIDGYNRHYLTEKECAFRSTRLAARGYRPKDRVTADGLRYRYPLLPTLPNAFVRR